MRSAAKVAKPPSDLAGGAIPRLEGSDLVARHVPAGRAEVSKRARRGGGLVAPGGESVGLRLEGPEQRVGADRPIEHRLDPALHIRIVNALARRAGRDACHTFVVPELAAERAEAPQDRASVRAFPSAREPPLEDGVRERRVGGRLRDGEHRVAERRDLRTEDVERAAGDDAGVVPVDARQRRAPRRTGPPPSRRAAVG